MASLALTVIAIFALRYLTGLGLAYYLTRRTPLFRYYPLLALFFAQVLMVLGRSWVGLVTPDGISTMSLWGLHGIGLACTAAAVRETGWRRLRKMHRFREGAPLAVVLALAAGAQLAPCLLQGDFCYVSHLNDEYLNYSSDAQWLMGRTVGPEFDQAWKMLGSKRFGTEVTLAYLAKTVSVPPIYAINLLQAITRVQYIAAVFVFFLLLFPRQGKGALAAAAVILFSPLEAENYVLAFLAHHSASSAIVVLGAAALYPVSRRLAVLQGVVLLFLGITYIEVLVPIIAVIGSQHAWQCWKERSIRPLAYYAAVCLAVGTAFAIRDPGQLTRYVTGLAGGNRAGFSMLGSPSGLAGDYEASLASLHAGIIGVTMGVGTLRLIPVMAVLALFGAGLWVAFARRRYVWVGVALSFVVVAHIDRVALMAGDLKLMEPVYQGPKSYLYFHFLWVVLAVGGALEIARRSRIAGVSLLAVWLIPVAVLGTGFAVRLATWPAVWTARGDAAIVAKLSPGEATLVGTRPAEEKLWRQLLAYSASPVRLRAYSGAEVRGQHVVARHRYGTRGMEFYTVSASGGMCPEPLAESSGFVLCPAAPGSATTEIRLRGTLAGWDSPWQPLVTCGTTGDAILFGMKKDGDDRALLTIDEWGIPPVYGGTFDVRVGEPFELAVHLMRLAGKVSAEHAGGGKVSHTLVSRMKLDTCEVVIGANDIGATTVSKKFNGELKDILAARP